MRALLLLSVTIDGSWKSVGYDQNLRGIHILSEKLKQWTLHGYLFYVLNMPVVHEVNNDGPLYLMSGILPGCRITARYTVKVNTQQIWTRKENCCSMKKCIHQRTVVALLRKF